MISGCVAEVLDQLGRTGARLARPACRRSCGTGGGRSAPGAPTACASCRASCRRCPARRGCWRGCGPGCGSPSSSTAPPIASSTWRGVTSKPGDLVVERVDVAVVLLPELDPAGVDELDAVAAGGLEPPRHRVAQLRRDRAAGLADQLEQHLVVAHQDQERLVDHRRVAQLGEHVARGQRRGGGLDDRGVAEQRVAVAGGERRGDQAAGARAQQLGAVERVVAALVGRQLARGVDLRARDVGVDVDAAGHHDHPASVDPAGVGPDVGDHLAVLQAHVADLAVDVVGGVVDRAAGDPDRGHRVDLREQPRRAARPRSARRRAAAPAASAARRPAGGRCRRGRRPAAAVRIDTSTPARVGRLHERDLVTPREPRRRASMRSDTSTSTSSSGCVAVTSSGWPLAKSTLPAYPVCQASTSSALRGPGGARQRQRDHVALVAQRPRRARAARARAAGRRRRRSGPARTRTRRGGRRRCAPAGSPQLVLEVARTRRAARAAARAGSSAPRGRARAASAAARRRAAAVAVSRSSTTTSVRSRRPRVVAAEAEPLEQPRMGGLGILAPDHDDPRAVADLAQRGGRRAAQRHRRGARPRPADALGRDQRPEPVGERDGGARVLHGGAVEAVQQRTARAAQQLGGAARAPPRRRPARRRSSRAGASAGRRMRSENHSAPSAHAGCRRTSSPERSTVTSSHSRPQPAHVTGAELSHGPAPRRGARTAGARRARRARARRRSAETSVHTGAPRLIVSPACGMSRTRPAGHQPGSGARRSRSANSTSFTFAHRVAGGMPAVGQAQAAGAPDVRLEAARAEQLERRRRPRVDLEHPGVAAVPDRVDAERPAHAEARRDLGADRAQLAVELGQLAVGQARRRHVARPPKPGGRCSCSVSPSTAAPPAVADRHRRAGQPVDAALEDLASGAAGRPSTGARRARRRRAAACAATPPGVRRRGARRPLGSRGARAPAARARRAHRPGIAHRRQQLGRRPEQLASVGEPRTRSGRFSKPAPYTTASASTSVGERRQRVVARRRRSGRDRAQVDVAEAVERGHLVAVGDRQLGEHPRADRDHEHPHGSSHPGQQRGQQRRRRPGRRSSRGSAGGRRRAARRRTPRASGSRRAPRAPPR